MLKKMADCLKRRRDTVNNSLMKVVLHKAELFEGNIPPDEYFMLELATTGATVKDLLEEVKNTDSDIFGNVEDDEIEAKIAEAVQCSLCVNNVLIKIRSWNDRMSHSYSNQDKTEKIGRN